MTNLKEHISELAALLKLHLLQEYGVSNWILTEPKNHVFFREEALAKKKKHPQSASASVSMIPPALPLPQPPPVSQKPPEPKPMRDAAPTNHKPPVEMPPEPPMPKPTLPVAKLPLSQEAPKQKKEDKTLLPKSKFSLEPISPPLTLDLEDIRALITEKIPALPLVDILPYDQEIKPPRQTSLILILALDEPPEHLTLLRNMGSAISASLMPAEVAVMETEGVDTFINESLTSDIILLIAVQPTLDLLFRKIEFLQHNKALSANFKKPSIFILDPISSYLEQPQKKQVLWTTLRKTILNMPR